MHNRMHVLDAPAIISIACASSNCVCCEIQTKILQPVVESGDTLLLRAKEAVPLRPRSQLLSSHDCVSVVPASFNLFPLSLAGLVALVAMVTVIKCSRH